MSIPTKKQLEKFQTTIWNYYASHKREMPWRGEKDPYKVLVSEIMLQQTQVTRVTQKYVEFLKKFPNFKILSESKLSDVLSVWSGLGYNRRAKFLHDLSKVVMRDYKGKLPNNEEELLSLPGIGRGTAGSLQAFAFNIPSAFIETNIRRVYIHFFFKNNENILDADILPFVSKTVDTKNPKEWYYALMDYGAYLKLLDVNPNTKSKHYVKQSVFKGSNREVRGVILKYLKEDNNPSVKKIMNELGFEKERFETALAGLIAEGLITRKKETIKII